jgi:flagellar motility protein MotE (MotC chaperone)
MSRLKLFVIPVTAALFCHALFSPLRAETRFSPATSSTATSVAERRIEAAIQTELKKLKLRDQTLEKKEMELKTLQAEVDKKLSELKKVRAEVTRLLERKTEQEAVKVKTLSKIYEKMEPANAASVIPNLDLELAVEILQNMKVKAAGRILDNLDAKTAARLSSSFPALARD